MSPQFVDSAEERKAARNSSKTQTPAPQQRVAPQMLGALFGLDPAVFLIRDPLVLRHLEATQAQIKTLAAFADEWNDRVFRLRDPWPNSQELSGEINSAVHKRLATNLTAAQNRKLNGLRTMVRGSASLMLAPVADELSLQSSQRSKLTEIWANAAKRAAQVQESSKTDAADAAERLAKLQRDTSGQLQAVLTKTQSAQWQSSASNSVDVAKLRPLTANAPSLTSATGWVNGDAIDAAAHAGKVLVVHFWAFGCINCIHNYEWYAGWQERFGGRDDFAMVGVHTPETEEERNADSVKEKVRENGMNYRIAIDGKSKVWDAWSNSIWPAVYLVDRNGLVRYWWYGELAWQGANGEPLLRGRIEELLAEEQAADKTA